MISIILICIQIVCFNIHQSNKYVSWARRSWTIDRRGRSQWRRRRTPNATARLCDDGREWGVCNRLHIFVRFLRLSRCAQTLLQYTFVLLHDSMDIKCVWMLASEREKMLWSTEAPNQPMSEEINFLDSLIFFSLSLRCRSQRITLWIDVGFHTRCWWRCTARFGCCFFVFSVHTGGRRKTANKNKLHLKWEMNEID